jgi:hypothetical protein
MVTNVPGTSLGNAPEDHGSGLLNGFQTFRVGGWRLRAKAGCSPV